MKGCNGTFEIGGDALGNTRRISKCPWIFFLARGDLKFPSSWHRSTLQPRWLIWLVAEKCAVEAKVCFGAEFHMISRKTPKKCACMAEIQRAWDVLRWLWYVELICKSWWLRFEDVLSFSVAWLRTLHTSRRVLGLPNMLLPGGHGLHTDLREKASKRRVRMPETSWMTSVQHIQGHTKQPRICSLNTTQEVYF